MAEESRRKLMGRFEGAEEQQSFARYVAVVELRGGRVLNDEMNLWLRRMGYEGGM